MKIIFLITIFISLNANACLNLFGTNIHGQEQEIDHVSGTIYEPTTYPSNETIQEEISRILAIEQLTQEDYTNLAAYHIYSGDYQKAIDLLNLNIKDKQNNYSFCSNIGVAFELVGNLDSAYYWTKKGVQINPYSHDNSEWIHLRILEIELSLQKDKNWLNNNSIFNFKVPLDSNFTVFTDSLDYDFYSNLQYQLQERTFFVKPHHQDKLVAKLILILADFVAVNYDTHECKATYKLAALYDTTLINTVTLRLNSLKSIEKKLGIEHYEFYDKNGLTIANDTHKGEQEDTTLTQKRASYRFWNIVVISIILIIAIVILVVLKKRLK